MQQTLPTQRGVRFEAQRLLVSAQGLEGFPPLIDLSPSPVCNQYSISSHNGMKTQSFDHSQLAQERRSTGTNQRKGSCYTPSGAEFLDDLPV